MKGHYEFSEYDIDYFCKHGYLTVELPTEITNQLLLSLQLSQAIHSASIEQKREIFCGNHSSVYGYSPSGGELDLFIDGVPRDNICYKRKYRSYDFGSSNPKLKESTKFFFSNNIWPSWLSQREIYNIEETLNICSIFLKTFLFSVFDYSNISYEKNFFENNPSIMRLIEYNSSKDYEVKIPPHTDYEFITLSFSLTPGLQVQKESWENVKCGESLLTIMAGDCLTKVSGNLITSPLHRVSTKEKRHSIILFLCSEPNVVIDKNGKLKRNSFSNDSLFCPADHLMKMNIVNTPHLMKFVKDNGIDIELPKNGNNPLKTKEY